MKSHNCVHVHMSVRSRKDKIETLSLLNKVEIQFFQTIIFKFLKTHCHSSLFISKSFISFLPQPQLKRRVLPCRQPNESWRATPRTSPPLPFINHPLPSSLVAAAADDMELSHSAGWLVLCLHDIRQHQVNISNIMVSWSVFIIRKECKIFSSADPK